MRLSVSTVICFALAAIMGVQFLLDDAYHPPERAAAPARPDNMWGQSIIEESGAPPSACPSDFYLVEYPAGVYGFTCSRSTIIPSIAHVKISASGTVIETYGDPADYRHFDEHDPCPGAVLCEKGADDGRWPNLWVEFDGRRKAR